ncbi:MAG TPA: hypothetical protein GXX40_07975 [Firmicutes bacterium]|nr:hypothetical protein [Bacillota bacterium]
MAVSKEREVIVSINITGRLAIKIEKPEDETQKTGLDDIVFSELDDTVADLIGYLPATQKDGDKKNEVEEQVFLGSMSRSEALEKAIRLLIENNENVVARRGSRSEDADIIVEKGYMVQKINFYFSKVYANLKHASWSAIFEEDINKLDYFLFAINDAEPYFLLFSRKQMAKLLEGRKKDSNERLHCSFRRDINGHVYEVRGDKPVDVTYALNNFTLQDLELNANDLADN